jgi:hypothetical protein
MRTAVCDQSLSRPGRSSEASNLWRLLGTMDAKLILIGTGDAVAYHPVGRIKLEPPRLEVSGCYDLQPDDRVGVIFADATETSLVVVEALVEGIATRQTHRLRCVEAIVPDASGSPRRVSIPYGLG